MTAPDTPGAGRAVCPECGDPPYMGGCKVCRPTPPRPSEGDSNLMAALAAIKVNMGGADNGEREVISLVTGLRAALAEARAERPKCSYCANPATCFGAGDGDWYFGCDDCCGHSCEDARCWPMAAVPAALKRLNDSLEEYRKIEDEAAAAQQRAGEARAKAIEECAKVAETLIEEWWAARRYNEGASTANFRSARIEGVREMATRIRALAAQPGATGEVGNG